MLDDTNVTQPAADFMQAEQTEQTPQIPQAEPDNGTQFHSEEYAGAEHDAEPANITDITQLDLQTEALPDVDEQKLADRAEYAPSLQPGKFYVFVFALDEKTAVEGVTIKGKLQSQFNYNLTLIKDDGTPGKVIRFNQANTFRTGKMESSRAEELLFALGKLGKFQREKADHAGRQTSFMLELMQEAQNEGVAIRGQVNWKRYDKATKQTWSTNPSKPYKKINKETGEEITVTELPWPKDAQGRSDPRPEEFEGKYGNEIVSRVAPTKETLEAMKAEGQPPAQG